MKLKTINPDPVRSLSLSRALTASVMLCLSIGTFAAQEDTHEYRADGETTIETINGLRVITLRQNVYVRQDDVELTGDVAVLEFNMNKELQQVRLTGTPANFRQQQSEADTPPITGFSDTINYYAGAESIVDFIGSASFSQPGTTLQCAEIRHVIETGATSGQACSGSLSPQNPASAAAPQDDSDTALQSDSAGVSPPQPN